MQNLPLLFHKLIRRIQGMSELRIRSRTRASLVDKQIDLESYLRLLYAHFAVNVRGRGTNKRRTRNGFTFRILKPRAV